MCFILQSYCCYEESTYDSWTVARLRAWTAVYGAHQVNSPVAKASLMKSDAGRLPKSACPASLTILAM